MALITESAESYTASETDLLNLIVQTWREQESRNDRVINKKEREIGGDGYISKTKKISEYLAYAEQLLVKNKSQGDTIEEEEEGDEEEEGGGEEEEEKEEEEDKDKDKDNRGESNSRSSSTSNVEDLQDELARWEQWPPPLTRSRDKTKDRIRVKSSATSRLDKATSTTSTKLSTKKTGFNFLLR